MFHRTVMSSLSADEQQCFEQVYSAIRDELHPNYDTFFNVLRFCQSYGFNATKTIHQIRKHLRFRREYQLDEGECLLKDEPLMYEYAPMTILGPNKKNGDRVVVIDKGGLVDSHGLMKSIELTQYMHHRYRKMEQIFSIMKQQEKENGTQSYVYYIFDLHGLQFDPSLLSIASGPFILTWLDAGMHYREWIDKFIVVNAPTFVNLLWSAISPFINDEFKKKIMILSSSGEKELRGLIDPEYLPEMYGGKLNNNRVKKPKKEVPKSLYWKPRNDYPGLKELHSVSIPAGKKKTVTFDVKAPCRAYFYIVLHDQTTISITRTIKTESREKYEEGFWSPTPRAGVPSMDSFKHELDVPGSYHLHLANDNSWFFSITVKYLIRLKINDEIFTPAQNLITISKIIKH